ncbi:MAG: hypothetical protein C0429_17355 [Sphingopyxis sp.]|nr:hypothetical protein [Sphingopyxis sp.]
MSDLLTAAKSYIECDFALCQFGSATKGGAAMGTGWNLPDQAIRDPKAIRDGSNIGLLHVSSRTCALDLDALDGAISYFDQHGFDLHAALEAENAVQISSGRPNRGKLLYRMPDDVDPKAMRSVQEFGDNGKVLFELRCASADGKTVQDVLPPSIHPETNRPYEWAGKGDWRNIPTLPADLLELWLGLMARNAPNTQSKHGHNEEGEIITRRTLDELKSALTHIPSDDRETWVNIGMALKTLPDDRGRQLWLTWSATSDKFDDADAKAKWETFRPTNTNHKTVFAKAQHNGWRNPRRRDFTGQAIEGEILDGSEVSEDAVARAFTARFRDSLRFDFNAGRWFQWNDTRWEPDHTNLAFHFARELTRSLSDGQRSMCKAAVAGGIERFARADPAHATVSSMWDNDPMLLGTPSGTVDLVTGKISPPNPAQMITKLTAVGPEGGEPILWLKFLNEALDGDQEAIFFLQQWFGYCLTGDTREHSLTFLHGPGGNGKSVCINTLIEIMGDYAITSTMDTFTASKFDKHSTDLAMLRGARLVTASETEEGRAWAEARIKQLTGGDPITARFMRQDNFTFKPQFKLMIAGNHAPSLRNVDDAMRRRLIIMPFINKPTAPDRSLETKLRAEHGRILNWAIKGCIDWLSLGLVRPASITKASNEYFTDQDLFGQWLEERCDLDEAKSATPTRLFQSWSYFAKDSGEQAGSMKGFTGELQRRGFRSGKSNGARLYKGLSLKSGQFDDE